jgi:L-lactate dehydrogenase complex protein LldF
MSIKIGHLPFKEHVDQEVQDTFMRGAIAAAQDSLRGRKIAATSEDEDFGDWEAWRAAGEEIRRHTLENLDYYLHQLSENIAARGGHVYFAATAEEANAYIQDVMEQKQAKRVVKTKSMVTEEIGLNETLENMGCDILETDLGEYILQIDGDRPSHFVAPSLHKNKEQIRDTYTEKIGYTGTEDPAELTNYTREVLREKFLQAEVGITGCNFAIANSGAIALVTNEGNANMVTTLPETQISVMGMERIVPTWEDLDVLVSLLCRSAVGQNLSTYVTVVSPELDEATVDAPKDFHLVILDGGRSKALGTEFQEALHCIRCAACVNVCPVYRQIGGHAYGSIYQGPIGAVLSPILGGYEEYGDLPHASSLCGACTEACPVNIPIHDLLVRHREKMVREGDSQKGEQFAMKAYGKLTESPTLFNMAVASAKTATAPFAQNGMLANAPGALKDWTRSRNLPAPDKLNFRKWFDGHQREGE